MGKIADKYDVIEVVLTTPMIEWLEEELPKRGLILAGPLPGTPDDVHLPAFLIGITDERMRQVQG